MCRSVRRSSSDRVRLAVQWHPITTIITDSIQYLSQLTIHLRWRHSATGRIVRRIQSEYARIELVLRPKDAVLKLKRQLRFVHDERRIVDAAVPTTAAVLLCRCGHRSTALTRQSDVVLLLLKLLLLMLLQHVLLLMGIWAADTAEDAVVRFRRTRRRRLQLQPTGEALQLFEHLLLASPAQRRRDDAEQSETVDAETDAVADEFGEAVRGLEALRWW